TLAVTMMNVAQDHLNGRIVLAVNIVAVIKTGLSLHLLIVLAIDRIFIVVTTVGHLLPVKVVTENDVVAEAIPVHCLLAARVVRNASQADIVHLPVIVHVMRLLVMIVEAEIVQLPLIVHAMSLLVTVVEAEIVRLPFIVHAMSLPVMIIETQIPSCRLVSLAMSTPSRILGVEILQPPIGAGKKSLPVVDQHLKMSDMSRGYQLKGLSQAKGSSTKRRTSEPPRLTFTTPIPRPENFRQPKMLDSSITSLPSTSETNVRKSTMHETPSISLPSSLETNAKTSAAPEHKNPAAVVELSSSSSSPLSSPPASPTQVDGRKTLSHMGFSEEDINLGLKESDGDVRGAVEYLLGYSKPNEQTSDAQEVIKHQSKADSKGPLK
ncbi:MAG: hypothetical protein Q9180_008601, partial [Flavoplaca navasiana]